MEFGSLGSLAAWAIPASVVNDPMNGVDWQFGSLESFGASVELAPLECFL